MENPTQLRTIKLVYMKKIFFGSVFFFIFSMVVKAQSFEETQITIAVAALNKAMIDADKITLENLTDDELSYGHSTGKVENKTEYVASMVGGPLDFSSIDVSNQTIKLVGKNAIVRHAFSAKLTDGGTAKEVKINVLMVWKKEKRKWKLLARQGYKI